MFLSFIFITATAFPFLHLAQAFPAQSIPSPAVSPRVFAKPGTLLGKPYTLHDRTDAFTPFDDIERRSQPDQPAALGGVVRDGLVSRAARFEYSQRQRRGTHEDSAVRRENFLSDVHPEPVAEPAQTSATTDSAQPAHNTSVTLIPRPASTAPAKAEPKKHRHASLRAKKSKPGSVKKE